jgi:hypothetical protein
VLGPARLCGPKPTSNLMFFYVRSNLFFLF